MKISNPPTSTSSCSSPPAPTLRSWQGRTWSRVSEDTGPDSMTKQEFKDDCDINRILAKFQRTGAIAHFAKNSPIYGDFTACDFHTAQNIITRATQLFAELPSSIRELTKTPAGFLDFVQNPANAEKMRELGLTTSPSTQKPPAPQPNASEASPNPPQATTGV